MLRVLLLLLAGPALAEHPCREGAPLEPGAQLMWRSIETSEPIPADITAGYVNARDPDRYGRVRAHLFRNDVHVQEALIREGLAFAHPVRETEACARRLLLAEREARVRRRGVWRTRRVERAADPALRSRVGRFAIVEGRVRSVGARRRTVYLNFGQRWTTDFTVSAARRDLKDELLGRLEAATGSRVRVRGFLEERGGPLIRLHDKAQIEWLDRPN